MSERYHYEYTYEDLMKLIIKQVLTEFDSERITVIDDGESGGTVLFVIGQNYYRPTAGKYLMTYIDYGSCPGCDALMEAQTEEKEDVVNDVFKICKDLVTNIICPYNFGWYHDPEFDQVKF